MTHYSSIKKKKNSFLLWLLGKHSGWSPNSVCPSARFLSSWPVHINGPRCFHPCSLQSTPNTVARVTLKIWVRSCYSFAQDPPMAYCFTQSKSSSSHPRGPLQPASLTPLPPAHSDLLAHIRNTSASAPLYHLSYLPGILCVQISHGSTFELLQNLLKLSPSQKDLHWPLCLKLQHFFLFWFLFLSFCLVAFITS